MIIQKVGHLIVAELLGISHCGIVPSVLDFGVHSTHFDQKFDQI